MNEDKYLAESGGFDNRTSFHTEIVPPQEMDALLHAVDVVTRWADRVKRSLFYGAPLDGHASRGAPTSVTLSSEQRDLIHGILGVFTEAGELMQHLHAVLRGTAAVDDVNLIEELGDVYWYAAVLHRLNDTKFSDAMRANIAKLAKRYPEKFTEYHAVNRDLEGERQVLEEQSARHIPATGDHWDVV